VVDGKLYSFSGYRSGTGAPLDDVYAFNPASGDTGRWTALKNMPPMRDSTVYGGVTHAGIATDGRYIYIAGGYAAGSLTNNAGDGPAGQVFGTRYVMRYDPQTDTYLRLRDLPAESGAGSLAIANNELHFFGGTTYRTREDEIAKHWSLALDQGASAQWQVRADLPNPRHHMAAVSHNGKIYAVGGQHKHDGSLVPQSSVHRYDPASNTWVEMAPMPEGRNHIGSTTFVIGDKIIVIGGQFKHVTSTVPPKNDIFVYDISDNRWTAFTPLNHGRHSAIAGVINGQVYLTSGSTTGVTTDGGQTSSRRIYRGTLVFDQ
jgi:N-acetylneuraminic acid mutarotase